MQFLVLLTIPDMLHIVVFVLKKIQKFKIHNLPINALLADEV